MDGTVSATQDFSKNIFENYSGYDLSYLKGNAILIPIQELKMVNKVDHVVRLLNPYYSVEFENAYGNPEKRMEALFLIKDKWTKQELEIYI
jgi:hypothetical protein